MGVFRYGASAEALDDSDLALLQAVTTDMLRQRESFLATFEHPDGTTVSYWLHPSARLRFDYERPKTPSHDAMHHDLQLANAHTASGVFLVSASMSAWP